VPGLDHATRHLVAAFAVGCEHIVHVVEGQGVGYGDRGDPTLLDELVRPFVFDRLEEDETIDATVDEVFELADEHLAVLAETREDDVIVVELHLAFHLRHDAHGKMVEHVVDEQAD